MSGVHLNRKLVLEAPVRIADGAGGHSETWQVQGTLWAQIKAGTGRESAGQFLTVSSVPYKIIVRAAPDGAPSRPKPEQRFREGNRVFRILAVSEFDAAAHYLTCHAREEVSA
ncbi:MAG: head-tail adaptor protein [Marinosulfonomonas sp.]|nr:head-tail adaptor protein [Marinosulfonomonas sp.]